MPGKSQMQFGGAAGDLPHALEHRCRFQIFSDGFLGQQTLLVDETVERGAGDAPGVALVLDAGMHDRERRALIAFRKLERAEQGGHIREMRDVGQEAPDLDLRMNAGGDAAQDLHDIFPVRDHA